MSNDTLTSLIVSLLSYCTSVTPTCPCICHLVAIYPPKAQLQVTCELVVVSDVRCNVLLLHVGHHDIKHLHALIHWAEHVCLFQVRPWVVDVSADIKRHPDTNEITYHGHYQGADPQPTGEPGFIMMESNLVVYKLLSSRPS